MKIIKENIADREKLNELGYNSEIFYCGNYSMEKFYSYIYNYINKKGVEFALNRACFIHDLNYAQKPTIREKALIDWNFFKDMQKCLRHHRGIGDISRLDLYWLRCVSVLFYAIVILATPFYVKQGKIIPPKAN